MKKLTSILILSLAFFFTLGAQNKLPDKDWANFGRYNNANEQVSTRPVAVLMGDSITDGWARMDSTFFETYNLVGRGISGQVTSHMLVRFRRDVVDLHPKYVVILAGINDIARNNGKIELENTMGNIISMCEIAKANKIKPVLCTMVPADHIQWRPALTDAKEQVAALNALIKDYAAKNHLKVVDYTALMADETGGTRKDLSNDSVHPTLDGYKLMEAELLRVLGIKAK